MIKEVSNYVCVSWYNEGLKLQDPWANKTKVLGSKLYEAAFSMASSAVTDW